MKKLKVKDHNFFGSGYISHKQKGPQLGDVLYKFEDDDEKPEIGVVIQTHGKGEYRTDQWGSGCFSKYTTERYATRKEVELYRPELVEHLK
jgi:hypothetical protein